jgi:adenosine kinase
MTIVVTGSIAYDYLMTFPGHFKDHILPDQLDKLSLSFLVDSMTRRRGGCATNIAYSLALLGERPQVMATVGEDFSEYRQWLEARGVDTSRIVEIKNESTASFFVNTDQSQSQIASFYTGAMSKAHTLSFCDLECASIAMTIISPNDPQAMIKYAQECQQLHVPYLYDPSQQIIRLSGVELEAGINGARALIVNEYELEMIRKKTGLSEVDILRRADVLVVTLGERGSLIRAGNREIAIPPAAPRRIIDPTGVGDAYRAGFIVGLLRGYPWEVIGRIGSLAATYVLEEAGTQSHYYTIDEFIARYRESFGDTPELADMQQKRSQ